MDAFGTRDGVGSVLAIDLRFDAVEAVMRIEKEIARVLCSQVTMRKANRALREGRTDELRAMQFSMEHIAELTERVKSGAAGFPDYVLRNNAALIRALRVRQRALLKSSAPAASAGQYLASVVAWTATASDVAFLCVDRR